MNHEDTRQHRRRTCSCHRQEELVKSKAIEAARPKVTKAVNAVSDLQRLVGMKIRNYS